VLHNKQNKSDGTFEFLYTDVCKLQIWFTVLALFWQCFMLINTIGASLTNECISASSVPVV